MRSRASHLRDIDKASNANHIQYDPRKPIRRDRPRAGQQSLFARRIRPQRLWVRLRGAPVEAPKEGIERGTYRHPEFYGKHRSRDMHYEPVGE